MIFSLNIIPLIYTIIAFILAIQKLVIKDVVLYKDKKIEATKKIVNK